MMTALEYEEYVAEIRKYTGDSEQEVRQWISDMAASVALEFPYWSAKKFIAIVGRYPTKDEVNLIRNIDLNGLIHLL